MNDKLKAYPLLPPSLLEAILEKNADTITSKIIRELQERL